MSIARIHFGMAASSPGLGRPCQVRAAINTNSTPNTSLRTFAQVAGSPLSDVAFPLAATRVIAPMIERPASHPTANAGPFALARGVPSMRTIAMMGTGLIATPIAIGSVLPIA